MKRRLKGAAGALLFFFGVWLAGHLLWGQVQQIDWATLHIRPVWLAAALVVNLCYIACYTQLWVRLAAHNDLALPPAQAYGITLRALAFKYLPLRVAGVGYRLWAYHREGNWPLSKVAAALYGESALVAISGALVLACCGPWITWGALGTAWLWGGCAAFVLLATALLARVASRFANRDPRRTGAWHQVAAAARMSLSSSFLLRYGGAWLLLGGGLWLTVAGVGEALSLRNLIACLWAYPLAGLAGMVALFAPAGVGVREGVLALALATVLPAGAAGLAALAARALILGAEIAAALVGQWLLRNGTVLPAE